MLVILVVLEYIEKEKDDVLKFKVNFVKVDEIFGFDFIFLLLFLFDSCEIDVVVGYG